ncbi:MAG TPA: 2-C-methyl-D-erythritol 2,4-cyclodiphosphate synthase [Bacillota bacterium]|nr:2-C-methyl-D-erythritol 2,4-cyclodiphosphate synthase [Bacillota bacterium]HOL08714.1 2-C-methyl-D-erythritol 2,4-cyclodiphosphate synthase [Bacillota bacterium]HPO96383.1 2-C-methyl-D-erythritol 2,4-cyclodiphosphate synthase [Bacillota bacterium]
MRIGQGYDVHRLVEGRKLIIGGVEIPYEKGLLGHSDADVLTHAIMDALLGAIGAGDIGGHFPDNNQQYKDADSLVLLKQVLDLVAAKGYSIVNIDATIIAQKPKMANFIPQMRQKIAAVATISVEQINIKATTTEGLGFTGRSEGIAAQAVVLLQNVFRSSINNEAQSNII